MYLILLSLAGSAFVLSLFLTPVVRSLALKWNLVDAPNARKVHKNPIPRVGGVALFLSLLGSCLMLIGTAPHYFPSFALELTTLKAIGPATILIFAIGLADDLLNLKPWHKFLVQIIASLMVISADVHLGHSFLFAEHPFWARAGTLFWLLLCTNAVNLIDGLDGLAAGISLLATITTLIASLLSGNYGLAVVAVPLLGALLGFLVYNSNPASIFLGDSGSLVLGFLLGCFALLWSLHTVTVLDTLAPFMTLSVPLLDTSLAIVRRLLRAQPIFMPDRSHIHHRLLALGLTHRRAVLSLYGAGMVAGILSLSMVWAQGRQEFLILCAFTGMAALGIKKLGYPELGTAKGILLRRGLRREINAHLQVQNLRDSLKLARTAEDCWAAVQSNSNEFGFNIVRMRLAEQTFGKVNDAELISAVRIMLSQSDWIDLSLDLNTKDHPNVLATFATTVQQTLIHKNVSFGKRLNPTTFPPVFSGVATSTIQ